MAFYTYSQNNSGGYWDYDEFSGTTHFLIVECIDNNEELAAMRAQQIIEKGPNSSSCPCCGDRWSFYYPNSVGSEPLIYDEPARDYKPDSWYLQDCPKQVAIHYLDGTVVMF